MDNKFILPLNGKEFVKFEGLLDMFHQNGGKSIKTAIILEEPLIIQATVEGETGTFQGIGDASPDNTNSMVAKHSIRMAETRAIARALRWYNNIGMATVEELGGDNKVEKPKKYEFAQQSAPPEEEYPTKTVEEVFGVAPEEPVQKTLAPKKEGLGDCPKCGGPLSPSKKPGGRAWCYPCYVKWKNANK